MGRLIGNVLLPDSPATTVPSGDAEGTNRRAFVAQAFAFANLDEGEFTAFPAGYLAVDYGAAARGFCLACD